MMLPDKPILPNVNVVTMSADVSLKLESGKYRRGRHQQTSYWLLKTDARLREQTVARHLCAVTHVE